MDAAVVDCSAADSELQKVEEDRARERLATDSHPFRALPGRKTEILGIGQPKNTSSP